MAEQNVVIENVKQDSSVDKLAEEFKFVPFAFVEEPQPAEPDKPKNDVETSRRRRKKEEKDKSEKPAEPDKPKNGKSRLVVKNDAEKQRKEAITAEVKRLQALKVPKEDIEMLIAAKFPVNKPAESPKKAETSARDAMFPVSFEVNGIKFRRLELTAQKISTVSGKEIDSFIPSILDAKNNEPDGCALFLAFQWDEKMLAPSGAKGNGKSDYEKSTFVTPPSRFPHDLDMCIIDAVLNVRVEKFTVHSIYTEFPGFVEFSVFNKRVKEGWFDCFDAPTEIYLADFTEFDFAKNGVFVDLYNK